MSYVALYRKFRPDNFADVKGQDHIVTTLRNQLRANRIGHAYLFTGTRGTGKTTMAKIFARAVNCENPNENGPCGECETCRAIASGASLNVVEIDAASNNGVDNVREIIEEVSYRPTQGRYKVYIIDEVHMLSPGAFNALLKTLEEPPDYVIFILATTEVHKLPITVLSRCQRYDFHRISQDVIADRMRDLMGQEEVAVEEKALRYIAKKADGSLRDALSLLDQCIAFHIGEELTYDRTLEVLGAVDTEVFSNLLRAVLARDVRGCIGLLEEQVTAGRELTQFVTDFTWYLRNVMLLQTAEELEDAIDLSSENMERLRADAKKAEREQILRYIRIFAALIGEVRYAAQKRVLIEIALIKLCRPQMERTDDAVIDRIAALEEQLESGVFVSMNGEGGEAGADGAGREALRKAAIPRRPELPKAIPEDIRIVIESWKKICADADVGTASVLQAAKPSLGADGTLELVYDAGDMNAHRARGQQTQEQIRELLSGRSGKEVPFMIRETENHAEFEKGIVDLRELIAFDITTED